jgi:hypothetical protein
MPNPIFISLMYILLLTNTIQMTVLTHIYRKCKNFKIMFLQI